MVFNVTPVAIFFDSELFREFLRKSLQSSSGYNPVVRHDKDRGMARKVCRPTCSGATLHPLHPQAERKRKDRRVARMRGERGVHTLSRCLAHMSKLWKLIRKIAHKFDVSFANAHPPCGPGNKIRIMSQRLARHSLFPETLPFHDQTTSYGTSTPTARGW